MSNAAFINGLVTPYYGLVAVGRPLPVAWPRSAVSFGDWRRASDAPRSARPARVHPDS